MSKKMTTEELQRKAFVKALSCIMSPGILHTNILKAYDIAVLEVRLKLLKDACGVDDVNESDVNSKGV